MRAVAESSCAIAAGEMRPASLGFSTSDTTPFAVAESEHAGRERLVLDAARDDEERVGEIDHDAGDGHLGGDVVLIRVRAEHEHALRFARRLEDAETRGVRVLEEDVDAAMDLR